MNGRSIPATPERVDAADNTSSLHRRVGRILIRSAALMMPAYPTVPPAERAEVESGMETFLVRQIFSMPRYLLVPFVGALLAFDLLPALTSGRAFCDLPVDRRASINHAWANSRIAQKRDLMKLIRNCALYYYLDHPLVRARLESGEREGYAG
jgi:hypothetical protein